MQSPHVHYCAACGGPQKESAREGGACGYCGQTLLPVGVPDPRNAIRCGKCHGLSREGASFCPGCGTGLAATFHAPSSLDCPGCGSKMVGYGLAPHRREPEGMPMSGCQTCGGAWMGVQAFDLMVRQAQQRAIASEGGDPPKRRVMSSHKTKVVYRPCPECKQMMQRKNFARVSGVIVDRCGMHGYFFEAGELEDVVAFVESGGLRLAQKRDAMEAKLEAQQKKQIASMTVRSAGFNDSLWFDGNEWEPIVAFVSWAKRQLFRRR